MPPGATPMPATAEAKSNSVAGDVRRALRAPLEELEQAILAELEDKALWPDVLKGVV